MMFWQDAVAAAPDISSGITQLTYSATVVWILQKLKGWKRVPWISNSTDQVNKTLAVLLSGVSAIGVHWTMTGTLVDGATVVIAIPSAANLLTGILQWFQSFVSQQLIYQATVKPAEKAEQAVRAADRVEGSIKKTEAVVEAILTGTGDGGIVVPGTTGTGTGGRIALHPSYSMAPPVKGEERK